MDKVRGRRARRHGQMGTSTRGFFEFPFTIEREKVFGVRCVFKNTLTIPTKSYHLSGNFAKGVILLDLEEKDLPGVIYRVVEQMAVEELINQEDKAAVMRLLLLRHKHVQQDSDKFSRFIRRNTSSYTSLTVIFVY